MSILVSIRCLVYNHASYLHQCLDGLVMQQADFDFEAIVHDDASTDGSAAIIREYAEKYPEIIKPIYETENQYSKGDGTLDRIMNAAIHPEARYIAVCEGDDYWTDPFKLQKQVNLLERHQDVGLVYGRARIYRQAKGKFSKNILGKPYAGPNSLIYKNPIGTLTTLFRKELYFRYLEEINGRERWLMGDYPIWIWFSLHCRIHYMEDIMAVYRALPESASHSSSKEKTFRYKSSILNVQLYFIDRYVRSEELRNRCLLRYYRGIRKYVYYLVGVERLMKDIADFYKRNHYYLPYLLTKIYPSVTFSRMLFKFFYKIESLYWKLKE